MNTNYIEELNEGQRAAVLYNEGPSLVIAGAGSGKTRVLTYKIAYLLENGYQPWNILALTFTNKAAREMKERIARQVGDQRARHLWMGTFHSIFLRILHVEAVNIGFTSQFTIYDTADSKSLMRSIEHICFYHSVMNHIFEDYAFSDLQFMIETPISHIITTQA